MLWRFWFWQEESRIYVIKEPFSLKFVCGSLFLSSWFGSNCHHQFYETLEENNFYFIVLILGRALNEELKGWTKKMSKRNLLRLSSILCKFLFLLIYSHIRTKSKVSLNIPATTRLWGYRGNFAKITVFF